MDIMGKDKYGREILREKDGESCKYHVQQDGKDVMVLGFSDKIPLSKVLASVEGMKTGPDPIEERREQAGDAVTAARDTALVEPLLFDGNLYDCDFLTQQRIGGIVAMIAAGIKLPKDFSWRDYNNVNQPMTAEGVLALAGAIFQRQYEIFQKSWAAKEEIKKSAKPEDVAQVGVAG